MYKENYDQAEIFNCLTRILARLLKQKQIFGNKFDLKPAGTKDKRARTSQRLSMKGVMAAILKQAVKELNVMKNKVSPEGDDNSLLAERVAVGNFEYKNNDIDMGDLKDNHFTIVLRNLSKNLSPWLSESGNGNVGCEKAVTKVEEADIAKAMNSLKHNGFINYFGLQRFGKVFFPKTSDVGLVLVKQDWMRAIELILYPRTNEKPSMARARAHWWMYRNANDALKLLEGDNFSSIEGMLLKNLACHHENDLLGALLKIAKHSLLLYMHSYQALLWNKVVSRRIEMFGEMVLVGDLVQMAEGVMGNLASEKDCVQSFHTGDQPQDEHYDVNLESVRNDTNANEDIKEDNKYCAGDLITDINAKPCLNRLQTKQLQLSYVTEDTLNKFTIQDVVMVLPGYGVAYPKNNELKQMYLDLMNADGLKNGFEDLRNTNDRFSLIGDYRKMVGKPDDLQYHTIRYSDTNQNLTLSDLDVINEKEELQTEKEGKYEALIIKMSLCSSMQSSMYATMAIREVTRMDTGKTYQTLLTDQHHEAINSEKGDSRNKRNIHNVDDSEIVTQRKLAKIEEEQ